jgi:glutathione S-transferase
MSAKYDLPLVTHYAEGSVQPLLVSRLIYRRVPSKVPIFIRPIVKGVFSKIDGLINAPDLEKHGKLVCSSRSRGLIYPNIDFGFNSD